MNERNREKILLMSDAWVEAKFRVCYLTEQHRQGNDYLNDILNAIRNQEYKCLKHLQALEHTRQQNVGETFTRLYTHNMDVDSINFKHLNAIDAESKQFDAICDGNDKLIETLKSSGSCTWKT